jgi:cytochrome c biogenesis protein CcdA
LCVLVGYSGSQSDENQNIVFKKTMFFILGIVVSMMIIGGIAGFVGQVAQRSLGRYWVIFAGIALIFLGLATLKFLPFRLSFGRFDGIKKRLEMSGAIFAGLALGGVVVASSICCNPAIFIVVGVAVLQGQEVWAVLLLGMFAIGFSLPLGAISLGISLGKARFIPKSADKIVIWFAGGIQLIVGFYFLITF